MAPASSLFWIESCPSVAPTRAAFGHLEGDGQRAVAQLDRQRVRAFVGEAALDHPLPAGNGRADHRIGDDCIIQHDRQVIAGMLAGVIREDFSGVILQGEGDIRLIQLASRYAHRFERAAGKQRAVNGRRHRSRLRCRCGAGRRLCRWAGSIFGLAVGLVRGDRVGQVDRDLLPFREWCFSHRDKR